EIVGRRRPTGWMGTVMRREPLTVAQFHYDTFEHLVVGHSPGRIEHANTPGDRLLALELARQNAKWSLLILDRVTDEVTLEEQLFGLFGQCAIGDTEHCYSQRDRKELRSLHEGLPF